jgi:hypothetical protein
MNKKDIYEEINDIDIYTKNAPMLLRDINKTFNVSNIKQTGVNVSFNIGFSPSRLHQVSGKQIQIITSSFDDFKDEILDSYDCDMTTVGYHPYTGEFIIHERFINGYEKKNFIVYYERSNVSRIEKLTRRARLYFNSHITIIKEKSDVDYRPYWKSTHVLDTISDVDSSPPYIQMYCSKYRCCVCKIISDYLLCKKCEKLITGYYQQNSFDKFPIEKMVVFGGVNGFGNIIANQAVSMGMSVCRTTREPKTNMQFQFDLTNGVISEQLMTQILEADCVVFNAYQTLENDHSIWTHTIDTFDEKLALERFKINCFGYVKILQQIIEARRKYLSTFSPKSAYYLPGFKINTNRKIKDIVFVCMDANESKFEGKLQDGKHLELNMAKSAFKQIFYTNSQVLASLGILTIFACPSWLSYHGISVDKIASKSEFLIPPYLCAKTIINYVKNLDLDELYSKKKYIHDITFYQCANSLDLSKVNQELINEENPIDKVVNLLNGKETPYIKSREEKRKEKEEEKKIKKQEEMLLAKNKSRINYWSVLDNHDEEYEKEEEVEKVEDDDEEEVEDNHIEINEWGDWANKDKEPKVNHDGSDGWVIEDNKLEVNNNEWGGWTNDSIDDE